ncbi:hypothetical protein Tco_0498366, partial [Tanacetum coccineum]
MALAGPDPEPMQEEFYATSYPDVHENPKLGSEELVIEETPGSTSRTLSSMQHLDETVNVEDQFLNENPTKDDQVHTSAPPVTTLPETAPPVITPPVTAPPM